MAETLTELSQRNEAFWIGLALFLLRESLLNSSFSEGLNSHGLLLGLVAESF